MRLAVSNLAWSVADHPAALERLAALGVQGVEVAPTRVAAWEDLTDAALATYRRPIEDAGLAVSSLQAIFFNRPQDQLLGDEAAFAGMCDHMRRIAGVASTLGAGTAVFGAPRNRLRGERTEAEAQALAVDRLRRLGDIASAAGFVIGMEPVPAHYAGDFLTTAEEVIAMVRAVDHPGVRVHLDTGCVLLGGGDIAGAIREGVALMSHFHAAEPDLASFAEPRSHHAAAAEALRAAGYDRWVAIEMREQPADPLEEVETAVRFVQDTYFGVRPS